MPVGWGAVRPQSLPVVFEPNRGQAAADVRFIGRSAGGALLLKGRSVVLRSADGSAVALVPENASAAPQVEGESPSGAISNYLMGADRSRWIRRVPQFEQVRYRDLYPGIDLVFHAASRALEYDLVVAPGADPNRIRLRYDGARKLALDAAGNLIVVTAGGRLEQKRPIVYQETAGIRREIAGRFVLQGRRVSFQMAAYDQAKPLVIDPVLVYGTYLGGLSRDLGNGVAVDGSGSAYLVGATVSADFPVTANALQVKHAGTPNSGLTGLTGPDVWDVFVAKFSTDGSRLMYSTFLGGAGIDQGFAIAVDRSGNAVVAGSTTSQNFPLTAGAFQKTPPKALGQGGFVSKLNADGSDLIYSSYLGGAGGFTAVQALVLDASGSAYLAGATDGGAFPTTTGSFQTTPGGGNDCFVAKVNPQGSALVYATLLGGKANDAALGIAVNAPGNAYVTGSTVSTDFPISTGAAQTKYSGNGDAFAAELNAAGTALVYSTFVGGASLDTGYAIALDADGSAVIAGSTTSADFPTTEGAFQPLLVTTPAGASDAFVVRLKPGGAVQYATLLGGSGSDSANAIAVSADGSAIVAGQTNSVDFPLTADAYESTLSGSGCQFNFALIGTPNNSQPCQKTFLTIVHVSGRRLVYSSYLGGSGDDTARGLAVAGDGTLFLAGSTGSADFPVTGNAFQSQKKIANCTQQFSPSAYTTFACEDAFLVKIDPATAGPPRIMAAVSNATNGVRRPIAPGEIVTLAGLGIGPQTAAQATLDARGYLATTLSGTSVFFNGLPAPLLYVGPNQINAIVPFAIAGAGTATMMIKTAAYSGNVGQVAVTDTAPGLVSMSGTGQNQAAAFNQDGTLNSASNPAARGSIIVLYGTGVGQTSPAGIDGHLADYPAPLPKATVFAIIGGLGAQVLYAGDAPGLVEGAVQINAVIPNGVTPGSAVSVQIAAGSASSQPLITIAVK
jgi:uncharacterized protein (TIGR03437 family)